MQSNSSKGEVSIVTGLVVFSQKFGGAVFSSLAQVVFSSGLRAELATYTLDVDSTAVVAAGAIAVRSIVPQASLPAAPVAYSKAYDQVMYLATGAAGGVFLFAFGMGWVNIKKKEAAEQASGEKGASPPSLGQVDIDPILASGSDVILVEQRRAKTLN
ncbi:MAG: hypothetical protein Q9217_003450 [Psora testacea]